MADFTSGPWKVGRDGFNVDKIVAPSGDAVAAVFGLPMHTNVAEMDGGKAFGGKFAEGWANARLIAAAPCLLEALEDARRIVHANYCDRKSSPDTPEIDEALIDEGQAPIHCEECKAATAAIAKARGAA